MMLDGRAGSERSVGAGFLELRARGIQLADDDDVAQGGFAAAELRRAEKMNLSDERFHGDIMSDGDRVDCRRADAPRVAVVMPCPTT